MRRLGLPPRLKDDNQVVFRLRVREVIDKAQGDGHVHVVPAGVHHPLVDRSKVAPRLFANGQAVEVATIAYTRLRL
ncbi:hypothetical protein GCM10025858_19830 [Alicyclobacillus sacchari]|nr:hypothetical protein GCM10025858_19830 [Alicyclobacillus sacchari]